MVTATVMDEFFRKGDKVIVKTIQEIKDTKHTGNYKQDNKHFSCTYRGLEYSVFCDFDHHAQGKEGVIQGGIYDYYMKVMIDGKVHQIPAFALKRG